MGCCAVFYSNLRPFSLLSHSTQFHPLAYSFSDHSIGKKILTVIDSKASKVHINRDYTKDPSKEGKNKGSAPPYQEALVLQLQ